MTTTRIKKITFIFLGVLLLHFLQSSFETITIMPLGNHDVFGLSRPIDDARFGSALDRHVTGGPVLSYVHYINEIRKRAEVIANDPFHSEVPMHIAKILDASLHIPLGEAYQIAPQLNVVDEVLQINPVRPAWHVSAIRALLSEEILYIHFLEQIIDATAPFEYYERLDFANLPDAEGWRLYEVGLDPPIVAGWDLPFLRATTDSIHEEPIHAQLLLTIARLYQSMNLPDVSEVYYDRYLSLYFPRFNSLRIIHEEYLGKDHYIDPFFLDQPALSDLNIFTSSLAYVDAGLSTDVSMK